MKLDHVAIQVKNIENSVKWYVSNLEADILHHDDTWAMLQIGDLKLALTIASQHPPHFAFKVDDVKKIPSPAGQHRDGSFYRYIKDLDGNVIEYVYYPETD